MFGNKTETMALVHHLVRIPKISVAVICLTPYRRNLGSVSGASETIETECEGLEVPVLHVEDYSLRGGAAIRKILSSGFDLGFSYGWQRLIPDEIIGAFPHGIFGWHGSPFLFPYGRGRSPINWALRLGLDTVHHYLFQLETGADTGPVFDVKPIEVGDQDYVGDVFEKCHLHALESSLRLVQELREGRISLRKQAGHVGLLLPSITPDDSRLEPEVMTVAEALRIIKASSKPFPGAFIRFPDHSSERIFRVWRATPASSLFGGGRKVVHGETKPFNVTFADGEISILDGEWG